jgi:hypothetical protein
MMVAQPPLDPGRPRPPRGRPCRPAGTPRPGPAGSAPSAERSRPPARSRSAPRRPAPDSARAACARPARPAGRRSAVTHRTTRRPCGVARTPQLPQPTTVAVVWTASCHSPPTTSPRRLPSRPGPAAAPQTHYPVAPPAASFLQTSDIRKLCEVSGPLAPTSPSEVRPTTVHDEEPLMGQLRRFASTASTLAKLARAAEGLFSPSRPLCGFGARFLG